MKVHLATLSVCTVLLFSFGSAQVLDRFNFGTGVGFTVPTGNAGNNLNTGWNIDLRGGANVSHNFAADLDFTYNYSNLNHAALARFHEPSGHVGFLVADF